LADAERYDFRVMDGREYSSDQKDRSYPEQPWRGSVNDVAERDEE
jgi:hypothetical protein